MHVCCICAATAIVCYETVRVELSNGGSCETRRRIPLIVGDLPHAAHDLRFVY